MIFRCTLLLSYIFLIATTLVQPANAENPKPLSIDEAMAKPLFWGHTLSPSGRYLAAVARHGEDSAVVVYDLSSPGSLPVGKVLADADVGGVDWASDDRLLYTVLFWTDGHGKVLTREAVESAGIAIPVSRIVAVDRDGGHPLVLFGADRRLRNNLNLSRVTDLLSDDPDHVLVPAQLGNDLNLLKVNVHTGTYEVAARGNARTVRWYTDSSGQPAFRLDINAFGSAINVYARVGESGADGEQPRWRKIWTLRQRSKRDDAAPDFYPLAPGPTPLTYYVSARPDGADTTGIYLYDLETQSFIKTLKTVPGIDVEVVFTSRITGEYLGAMWYADRLVTRFENPHLQAHLDALIASLGSELDLYVQDVSEDGSIWLIHGAGPRDRGSYFVYDVKARHFSEIGSRMTPLPLERFGPTEVLRYKARDGLEVFGYLTRPPDASHEDRPPLIVMPHGGPETRDLYGYDPLVQLLVTRGYQVFQPNFRGSSGFGKKFAEAGHGEWGRAMQNDVDDALDHLVSTDRADRNRACIVGGSYGGYVALFAATHTPEKYRCAVSIAGVSNLPLMLKHDKQRFADDPDLLDYLRKQVGDSRKDRERLEATSPVNFARAVQVPVLLIHGEEDYVVDIEQSERMEAALRDAGKSVQFIRLKDTGHEWAKDEEGRRQFQAVLDFVDEHLPILPQAAAQAGSSNSIAAEP